MDRELVIFHFAMLKECPLDLIDCSYKDQFSDNTTGIFKSIYKNIMIWISGVGSNNVLEFDPNVMNYLKQCDTLINFGLCGSIYSNLNVGDIVSVYDVRNLDVKIPDYPLGCTDVSGMSDIDILDLDSIDSDVCDVVDRVPCYTSNRFVDKEYLDFLDDEFVYLSPDGEIDDELYDLELPLFDSAVCDMELFYLTKLINLVSDSYVSVTSFKMVSDVVEKPDNYEEYEGSIKDLISKLHQAVLKVAKDLGE